MYPSIVSQALVSMMVASRSNSTTPQQIDTITVVKCRIVQTSIAAYCGSFDSIT